MESFYISSTLYTAAMSVESVLLNCDLEYTCSLVCKITQFWGSILDIGSHYVDKDDDLDGRWKRYEPNCRLANLAVQN